MSKIHSDSLEALIEQFLREKTGSGLVSISESAVLQTHLIEGIFPIHHLGYVRFLKNRGISRPKCSDLSEAWITEYNEYLLQNFGELVQQTAMESLLVLWMWVRENNYIRTTKEPGVFQRDIVFPRFRISLRITDCPEPTRRRS